MIDFTLMLVMCLLGSSETNQANSSSNINSLLRRSSRSKVHQSTSTTGSCVSSTASTSQTCTSYQIRGSASFTEATTSSTIASHSMYCIMYILY